MNFKYYLGCMTNMKAGGYRLGLWIAIIIAVLLIIYEFIFYQTSGLSYVISLLAVLIAYVGYTVTKVLK